MLVLGIAYHAQFMYQLRAERRSMKSATLIHADSGFPISFTLLTAVALLALGILAIISLVFRVGPFG